MGLNNNCTPKHEIATSVVRNIVDDLKDKLGSKLTGKHDLPWMRPKEVDILKELLLNLEPKRCLEWGAGFSTIYFPQFFDHDFQWHSVEHSDDWVQEIETLSEHDSVSIHHVPADHDYHSDKADDGAYQDYKAYIEYPSDFELFDFILVDGRARSECVKKAHELLNDNGVIVLHDANRTHYHEYFDMYTHQELFLDRHKRRWGVWIGSKEQPICELLNVEKFRKLYAVHNVLMTLIGKK